MMVIDASETDIKIAHEIIEAITNDAEDYASKNPGVTDIVSASDIAASRLLRIAKHILVEIGADVDE